LHQARKKEERGSSGRIRGESKDYNKMYKTIRHGENSLQYTILPQNDDFRIEGKLSGSGRSASTGGGASSSGSSTSSPGPVKAKGQRRRRSFFAYLGLIFVCTVIIGAVLIPFLVSAECLPNPTEWFLNAGRQIRRTQSRLCGFRGMGLQRADGLTDFICFRIRGTLPLGNLRTISHLKHCEIW